MTLPASELEAVVDVVEPELVLELAVAVDEELVVLVLPSSLQAANTMNPMESAARRRREGTGRS
jgi:hypothetical protein